LAQLDRTIRIFISSTFQDMSDERDVLTRHVFPTLRKEYEDLDIEILDIDLRWGVKKEQQKGETIATCFQCIDQCSPYFIGILGNRYGWIPEVIPERILEENGWLSENKSRSITELEIQYGALHANLKGDSNKKFFYFRGSDEHDEPIQLTELKNKIREHVSEDGISLYDGYQSIEEFRDQVTKDLSNMIEKEYSLRANLDELSLTKAKQESYIEKQTRFYIENEQDQDLDRFLQGQEKAVFLTGKSGIGKSSLIANWLSKLQQNSTHENGRLLYHFVGADLENSTAVKIYQRLIRQLANDYQLELELNSTKLTDLRTTFFKALNEVKDNLVLVIDALNQIEGSGAESFLFDLRSIPRNVKVIVSAAHQELKRTAISQMWNTLEIQPLQDGVKKELIRQYFNRYQKNFDPDYIDQIAALPFADQPLYLTKLIEEIRLYGDHDTLGEKIAEYGQTLSTLELLKKIVLRIEKDYKIHQLNLPKKILSILYLVKYGMTESQLRGMIIEKELLPIEWVPFFINIQTFLLQTSGRFTLFHDEFREVIKQLYLTDETTIHTIRKELVGVLENDFKEGNKWEGVKGLELLYQLEQLEDWESLYAILSDVPFLLSIFSHNEEIIVRYWELIETHSSFSMLYAYKDILEYSENYDEQIKLRIAQLFQEREMFNETLKIGMNIQGLWSVYIDKDVKSKLVEYTVKADELIKKRQYKQAESLLLVLDDVYSQGLNLEKRSAIIQKLGNLYFMQAKQKPELNAEFCGKALSCFKEESKILQSLNKVNSNSYINTLIFCLGEISKVYAAMGNLEKALQYRKIQVQYAHQHEKNVLLSSIYSFLAELYIQLKKEDQGAYYFAQAKKLRAGAGSHQSLINDQGKEAKYWHRYGFLEKALEARQEEGNLLKECYDFEGLATCLYKQSKLHKSLSQPYEAFLKMAEAIIYLKVRGKVHPAYSREVTKLVNLFEMPFFQELTTRIFDVSPENWTNARFIKQFLTEMIEELRKHSGVTELAAVFFSEEVDLLTERKNYLFKELVAMKSRREAPKLILEVLQDLDEVCVLLDDPGQDRVLRELSEHLAKMFGNGNEYFKVLERRETLLRKENHLDQLQYCLTQYAIAYSKNREYYLALSKIEEQQKIVRETKNIEGIYFGAITHAQIYRNLNNFEKAISIVLDIQKYSYVDKGRAFYHALKFFTEAFMKKYKGYLSQDITYNTLPEFYRGNPIFSQAGEHIAQSYLSSKQGDVDGALKELSAVKDLYRQLTYDDLVLGVYDEQIKVLKEAENQGSLLKVYEEWLNEARELGMLEQRLGRIEEIVQFCGLYGYAEEEYLYLDLLRGIYKKDKNHAKLFETLVQMRDCQKLKQPEFHLEKTELEKEIKGIEASVLNPEIAAGIENKQKNLSHTFIDGLQVQVLEKIDTNIEEARAHFPSSVETDAMLSLDLIVIPDSLQNKENKRAKIDYIKNYYLQNGLFNEPVILDRENILSIGYSIYLAAVELKVPQVPVRYVDKDTPDEILLRAKTFNKKKNQFLALKELDLYERVLRYFGKKDELLRNVTFRAVLISLTGNYEKALGMLYKAREDAEYYQNNQEEQMKLKKTIFETSKKFHKKYHVFFENEFDVEDVDLLFNGKSIFQEIGELEYKKFVFEKQKLYVQAMKVVDEIKAKYRGLGLKDIDSLIAQNKLIQFNLYNKFGETEDLAALEQKIVLELQKSVPLMDDDSQKSFGYLLSGVIRRYLAQSDFKQALHYLKIQKSIYIRLKKINLLSKTYSFMSLCAEELGDNGLKAEIDEERNLLFEGIKAHGEIMSDEEWERYKSKTRSLVSALTVLNDSKEEIRSLDLIKIPSGFQNGRPNPNKIQEKIEIYQESSVIKPIIIDNHNILLDGYISYLVAKELKLGSIPVKVLTEKQLEETSYRFEEM
jgi:hypothetical protein